MQGGSHLQNSPSIFIEVSQQRKIENDYLIFTSAHSRIINLRFLQTQNVSERTKGILIGRVCATHCHIGISISFSSSEKILALECSAAFSISLKTSEILLILSEEGLS